MTHYEKYKDTIKEGVKKARRKRDIWINEYLGDKSCVHCGESETCALVFYPDNKEIRIISRSKDSEKNSENILEKIRKNKIVCMNCRSKLE